MRIATLAVDRLSGKLREAAGSGRAVDMEEEFRLLTLQVIGEAILGLHPEECDRVPPPPPLAPSATPSSVQKPSAAALYTTTGNLSCGHRNRQKF